VLDRETFCFPFSAFTKVAAMSRAHLFAHEASESVVPPAIQELRVLSFPARGANGVTPVPSPLRSAFAEAWRTRLSRTPHANFTMSLEYLDWQARRGESARAVLVDDEYRHGVMVLRERGAEIVSGFPWRWQIAVEDADPTSPLGMTSDDAGWFFAHAQRLAEGRRLRFYAPRPPGAEMEYLAARTVMIDLVHSSEPELLAALDPSRRRLARRSEREGYQLVDGPDLDQQQSFGAVVAETGVRRHGLAPRASSSTEPRELEWEQPFHWLLVATRNGSVAAGLGMGRIAGGMVDGRASGATDAAMKVGVPSMVWWEAIRRARLAGHSWMNLGGSTTYKRQFGGTLVPIHCALGGAGRWRALNLLEKLRSDGIALAVRTRNRVATRRGAASAGAA
jgi:hypothetical protein